MRAPQGLAIYSPDGTAYLVALYTGRLVLINTARALLDPGLYQSGTIIWSSGTSGGPDPLSLVMQEVRAPLLAHPLAAPPLRHGCDAARLRRHAHSMSLCLRDFGRLLPDPYKHPLSCGRRPPPVTIFVVWSPPPSSHQASSSLSA